MVCVCVCVRACVRACVCVLLTDKQVPFSVQKENVLPETQGGGRKYLGRVLGFGGGGGGRCVCVEGGVQ